MFISVLLPDPLGPRMATNSAAADVQAHVVQRVDRLPAERVGPEQVFGFDHKRPPGRESQ